MTTLRYERETTLVYNEEEDLAMVWSASPTFHRHMERIGVEPYKVDNRKDGERGCWYKVPKTWIIVRPPIRRTLTQEQRIATAERLRRSRFSPAGNITPVESATDRPPDGAK